VEKFKKRAKYIIILFVVMIFVGIVTTPSKEEQKEITKQEIVQLKEKLKQSSKLDVETNLYTIKKLLEHEPDNEKYKKEYKKYSYMDKVAQTCRIGIKKRDIEYLKNPETYDNQQYLKDGWINDKVYVLTSAFTGKNKLDIEYKFKSQYKCIIKDDAVTIENIFINKI